MAKIEVGMIVRYAPEWCSPGERKYLHLVKENRLNPVTGEMTRWLIHTLNSCCSLGMSEDVDDFMIEPTGLTIDDVMQMIEQGDCPERMKK